MFKNWIKSNQRIAGQPNINGQEYLYSPIVLPPISVQSEIVKKVKIIKDEFQVLKLKAESKRKEAIKDFEQAIFKN